MNNSSKDRVVLAYSGGGCSSAAIRWLSDNFDDDIVTLTVDIGQGTDLTGVRERALAAGAVRAHVIEARDEFVREFVLPSLHAGALLDERVPLAQALSQALVAHRLVDLARMEGAIAVAHASPGVTPESASRLDVAIHGVAPSLRVIVVPRSAGPTDGHGVDVNLWGRTMQCNADSTAPYTLTRGVDECPDEPAFVDIEFDAALPVRANGIEMPMLELIESLEIIAGAHGVGRVESSGRGPRLIAEAPAAVVLHTALRHLESTALPAEFRRLKSDLAATYADLVFRGCWYSGARQALDTYVRRFHTSLSGVVRVELFKGSCRVVQRDDSSHISGAYEADVRPAVEA